MGKRRTVDYREHRGLLAGSATRAAQCKQQPAGTSEADWRDMVERMVEAAKEIEQACELGKRLESEGVVWYRHE